MRLQVIFVVMLVLATSVLGACPACERAHLADSMTEAANLPASGHSCCERTQTAKPGTHTSPEPDPNSPRHCVHEAVSLTFEAASTNQLVAPDLAAVPAPAAAAIAGFRPLMNTETPRVAMNPSPPAILSLPIRI